VEIGCDNANYRVTWVSDSSLVIGDWDIKGRLVTLPSLRSCGTARNNQKVYRLFIELQFGHEKKVIESEIK
jgi:hypothetical protein